MFNSAEIEACGRLIELAVAEDLGTVGDITSQAIIPKSLQGKALFVARAPGVVAGLPAAALVIAAVEPRLVFEPLISDGSGVKAGDGLARVGGPMRGILAAERTALNFLQHLSGIATLTRRYVDAVAGLNCKILDTRKTTPAWRLLEKYAVRLGGGYNHRTGLFDGMLIKDNHWVSLGGMIVRRITELCRAKRETRNAPFVAVEVDNLLQLKEILPFSPDIVMLDNMSLENMREAVRCRNARSPRAPAVMLEASGGITLANVRAVAETGVDRISVGALTHSAPALDIALDYIRK
jgi:nicotinate-nucleotide pyrophosphorylase (carboxylating)